MPPAFTHLHVHSSFSFGEGVASPVELVARAKKLGMRSLALTDHDGLYGAIRFYSAAREAGVKPIVGVELAVEDGHLVLLAQGLNGYRSLCRLVSAMHLRTGHRTAGERRAPGDGFAPPATATFDELAANTDNLFALTGCARGAAGRRVLAGDAAGAERAVARLVDVFGRERVFVELQDLRTKDSLRYMAGLAEVAEAVGVGTVATNNVHYLDREDFRLHDVLVCGTTGVPLPNPLGRANGELYFKSGAQMKRLFARYPEAFEAAGHIADRCNLDLGLGAFRFPKVDIPPGESAFSMLSKLAFDGLSSRMRARGKPMSRQALARLQHELDLIDEMGFSEYFLVVHDIVSFAKGRGIPCSGRGSAGDSIVSYALGITDADPIEHKLLFERFLNPKRREMPDIDVDFCSVRRDEVIDYIYERFGRESVAMVATVATTTARSAVRMVARAFGTAPSEIDRLAKLIPWASARKIKELLGVVPGDGGALPELVGHDLAQPRYRLWLDLIQRLDHVPFQLGTHLGGFIITPGPITDWVPLQWSAKGVVIAQYDKDDISALGLVKMDILGLRMHTAIQETCGTVAARTGRRIDITELAHDDEATYALIRAANTVGCFQLESAGQRNLAQRLREETFPDIIAAISLFRPGPVQADMITPFIRRRHRMEPVKLLHPSLRPILADTYGVIVYQEQVLEIAAALAGFDLGEADMLRRAMTHERSEAEMAAIGRRFVSKAVSRGVGPAVADEVFRQLRGFAAYGFNKAHAACFAVLSYGSAYLKAHYPADFLCSVLNHEPMGFYSPRVVLNDARRNGVAVRGVDVNASATDFTVEDGGAAIRVGFKQVKGMTRATMVAIERARAEGGPFSSAMDFTMRVRPARPEEEALARLGAFESVGCEGPERAARGAEAERAARAARVAAELELTELSISAHPMEFFRRELAADGVATAAGLEALGDGVPVKVAGVLERRQTPWMRSGSRTMFITVEDETGLADGVIFERVLASVGKTVATASYLVVEGTLQHNLERGLAIVVRDVRDMEAVQFGPLRPGKSFR
jgi:DNA-directed DNA polymerase III PolC